MEKIYTSVVRMHRTHALLLVEVSVVCALLAFYAYCVVASAVQVALRQDALYSLKDERAKVAILEETYLAKVQGLSVERAHEVGLVPTTHIAYLSLKGPSVSRAE
jgi:hypothetical protein